MNKSKKVELTQGKSIGKLKELCCEMQKVCIDKTIGLLEECQIVCPIMWFNKHVEFLDKNKEKTKNTFLKNV